MERLHFCKFLRLNKCWIATAIAIHWTVHEASSARKSLNHSGFFSVWIWTIPHHLLTELALAEHRKINSIFIHYASHPKGSSDGKKLCQPKRWQKQQQKTTPQHPHPPPLHNIHSLLGSGVIQALRFGRFGDALVFPPNRLVDSRCFRPYLCSLAPPLFSQKEGFTCTQEKYKISIPCEPPKKPSYFPLNPGCLIINV